MYAVSSDHYSVDQQVEDVVSDLTESERTAFDDEFPEWPTLVWSGSWIDAEASGVDPEFISWVADWIERHTTIMWEDGKPWRIEDGDGCVVCNGSRIADDGSYCEECYS